MRGCMGTCNSYSKKFFYIYTINQQQNQGKKKKIKIKPVFWFLLQPLIQGTTLSVMCSDIAVGFCST